MRRYHTDNFQLSPTYEAAWGIKLVESTSWYSNGLVRQVVPARESALIEQKALKTIQGKLHHWKFHSYFMQLKTVIQDNVISHFMLLLDRMSFYEIMRIG